MVTSTLRKRPKRKREQVRKRGLQRVEVVVPADAAETIRTAAAILHDGSEGAARLREHLRPSDQSNERAGPVRNDGAVIRKRRTVVGRSNGPSGVGQQRSSS